MRMTKSDSSRKVLAVVFANAGEGETYRFLGRVHRAGTSSFQQAHWVLGFSISLCWNTMFCSCFLVDDEVRVAFVIV